MDKKWKNITTYNKSAKELAEKFDGLGGYPKEINRIFSLASQKNPKVFEIGCGSGRDSKEIMKYTNDYLGIDFSKELIAYARKNNPRANFKVADAEKFSFPKNVTAVFALASLLHSDKISLRRLLKKIFTCLNNDGLFFVSLKYGPYREELKKDSFGERFFYFYNLKTLKEITGKKI